MSTLASINMKTNKTRKNHSPLMRVLNTAWMFSGGKIGLIIFLIMGIGCLLYPSLSGIDATTMNIKLKLLPPIGFEGSQWQHILGTDQIGRDILVRGCIGLRYSFLIGSVTVLLMLIIGCSLGILAGYRGKVANTIIMRLADTQLSIPMIILAITILGTTRPTVELIILVLAVSSWPIYARAVCNATRIEKQRGYIQSARILGASDLRIVFLYILPSILPPIFFIAVLDVARIVICESVLGFLGLGVQPPTPTFGNVIADGRKYLINAWWIATMPGILLMLMLTSLNMIGSALERAQNKVYGG